MSGFYQMRAKTQKQKERRMLSLRLAMRSLPITATDTEIIHRAYHILLGNGRLREMRKMVADPDP